MKKGLSCIVAFLLFLTGCTNGVSESGESSSQAVSSAASTESESLHMDEAGLVIESSVPAKCFELPKAKEGYAPASLHFLDDQTFEVQQYSSDDGDEFISLLYRLTDLSLIDEISYPKNGINPRRNDYPIYTRRWENGVAKYFVYRDKNSEPEELQLDLPEKTVIYEISPKGEKALCSQADRFFVYDMKQKTQQEITQALVTDGSEQMVSVSPYIFYDESLNDAANILPNFLDEESLVVSVPEGEKLYWGILNLASNEVTVSDIECIPASPTMETSLYSCVGNAMPGSSGRIVVSTIYEDSFLAFQGGSEPSVREVKSASDIQFLSEDGTKLCASKSTGDGGLQIKVYDFETLSELWNFTLKADEDTSFGHSANKAISNDGNSVLLADASDGIYLVQKTN